MNSSRPVPPKRPAPQGGRRPVSSTGWKRRLVISPQGEVDEQFRQERAARPGRNEREAIRRGERPFFRQGERPPAASDAPLPPQTRQPGAPSFRGPRDGMLRNSRPFSGPPSDARSERFQSPQDAGRPRPYHGPGELRRDGPGRPDFRGPPRPYGPGRFSAGERFRRPEGAPRSEETQRGFEPWRNRSNESYFGNRPDRGQILNSPTLGGPVRPSAGLHRRLEPAPAPVSVAQLAAQVIERANRDVPADAALRSALKNARGLSPVDAEAVSHAVFQHYRWFGWLDAEAPIDARLDHAAELASRFERNPGSFSDDELREHALPAWTSLQVEAPPNWARSLQIQPRLWLRAHPNHGDQLPDQMEVRPGPFPGSFLYGGSEDLFVHPAFQAGHFEIQDLASQAVGLACAPLPTETWWDACAGEGGKTLHLSALMKGRGMIWASDRASWRLERLRRRTARAHCFNYRVAPWDGGEKPPTRTEFDGILVDAPCSGLGTWGRNPHARWTTTPQDVLELAEAQRRLLSHVRGSLKPGGRLVYAVCTLTRAETTEVAEWFTRTYAGEFEPVPVVNPFAPQAAPVTPLILWPSDTEGNGMFIASWRRKTAA